MYIGYDHCPRNLIPEVDIVQHRLDFELDFSMTDSQLRHALMYTKHRDNIIYTNSIDLATVLHQCKLYNIIPIIALNFFWYTRYIKETRSQWTSKITPAQFGRCTRLVADLITEAGFKEAYMSPLNEPTKWLNNEQIYQYSKAALNDKVKIIVGNDEFKPDMFDYLASRFADNPNVLIGYHALSSMGDWGKPIAYINRISMMKGLADNYKLAIFGNECGSWFIDYKIQEGHDINKKIIMECKNAGYDACLIVLPDLNINCIKRYRLGYRIWSNDYKTLDIEKSSIKYYNGFIEIIKQEGGKLMPTKERDLRVIPGYMYGEDVKEVQTKLRGIGFDLKIDSWYGSITERAVKKFQELMNLPSNGIVGSNTNNMLRAVSISPETFYPEVFQNIYESKNYSIEVIDYYLDTFAHPDLKGHGEFFVQAEQETGYPAEHQLANGTAESSYKGGGIGSSPIAQKYNNLYGWGIPDSGPTAEGRFGSFKECILYVPKRIKSLFLDPKNWRYNGDNIFGIEIYYSTACYNAVNKAYHYRKICKFLDAGVRYKVPEYIDRLIPLLEDYFIRKEE